MKEFLLLIRNEIDHQKNWSTDQHQQFLKKCEVYINDLKKGGNLKNTQPLVREGKMISGSKENWKENNFNENKEVIVGYYHIRAKDLDEAISIAKRNPEFEYGTTAGWKFAPLK